MKKITSNRLSRKAVLTAKSVAFCLILSPMIAISASYEQAINSNPRQAMLDIQQELELNPSDRELLFYKAVAYEAVQDTNSASKIYRGLIKQHPDQPEPYLNLANIYSNNNNYKAAREILEQGFSSNKVYGKMYSNFKKLNGQLALEAYQLALNKSTTNTALKLTRVSNLHTAGVQIKEVIKRVEVPVEVIKEVQVIKEVEVPVEVIKEVQVIKEVRVPVEIIKEVEVIKEVQVPVEVVKQIPSEAVKPNLIASVEAWARYWSDKNVDKYISAYAPNYSTANKTRSQWVYGRNANISNKKFINVVVSKFKQKQINPEFASVIFQQSYKSDNINDVVMKELSFKKFSSGWKIVGERIVGK